MMPPSLDNCAPTLVSETSALAPGPSCWASKDSLTLALVGNRPVLEINHLRSCVQQRHPFAADVISRWVYQCRHNSNAPVGFLISGLVRRDPMTRDIVRMPGLRLEGQEYSHPLFWEQQFSAAPIIAG